MLVSGQGETVNPLPALRLWHFGGFVSGLAALAHGLQLPIPTCWLLLLVSNSECLQGMENMEKAFYTHLLRWLRS